MDIEAPSAKAFHVSGKQTPQLQVPEIKYKVVSTYLHDREAYTEGLKFYQGSLYESTRVKGRTLSQLRHVELETGDVVDSVELAGSYLAEGLTILNEKIFQLTENSDVGLIYDVKDLKQPALEFEYKGWTKAWGLTDDGQYLIMSDGSSRLHLIHPESTELIGKIDVVANGMPCGYLNELERAGNFIYSNVLYSDLVVKIATDGNVIGQVDVAALRPTETLRCVDCIPNGIAHDPASGDLFITGKMWPKLFRISLFE